MPCDLLPVRILVVRSALRERLRSVLLFPPIVTCERVTSRDDRYYFPAFRRPYSAVRLNEQDRLISLLLINCVVCVVLLEKCLQWIVAITPPLQRGVTV